MILSWEELTSTVALLRSQDLVIVTTNGCFDILHIGHVRYLKEARAYGDVLIVLINNDSSVRRLKGKARPFISVNDRAELLDALWAVDYVIIFSDDTPEVLLREIRPNVHVKGGDYDVEDLPEAAAVKECGGKIVTTGKTMGKSTTELVAGILRAIASDI